MKSALSAAVVASVLALGCTLATDRIHVYPGPTQPASAVGTLRFPAGLADNEKVRLVAVDGERMRNFGECQHGTECQITLLPGTHTLSFTYRETSCDAKDSSGGCIRGATWYIPAGADKIESAADRVVLVPLQGCGLFLAAPSGLGGLVGGIMDATGRAMQQSGLKGMCESGRQSGEGRVSFEAKAGKFYEASFSAAGPELRVKIEPGMDPEAAPVKE